MFSLHARADLLVAADYPALRAPLLQEGELLGCLSEFARAEPPLELGEVDLTGDALGLSY